MEGYIIVLQRKYRQRFLSNFNKKYFGTYTKKVIIVVNL